MRKIRVEAVQGNEILARNIYTNMDTILMPEGVVLRKEYIPRLKSLNIDYIYIEDDISQGVDIDKITEMKIKEDCKAQFNATWERISCNSSSELENVKGLADKIIGELLERPEIIFCVSGVRNKNEMIYSHSINVCAMSVFVAIRMKLSKKKIQEIAEGSLLHDIGFLNIPLEIRNKSKEEMNKAEKREIDFHTIYGYNFVEEEKWVKKGVKDIILYHHEQLDGKGYPFQREGSKISQECRIVSVCDTFDRMIYGIYEKKYKVHVAIEYIVGQAGNVFDREVVSVFNQSIAAYPNGTLVLTNKDEMGIVLRQNENFPARPVIRMLKDKKGKDYTDWVEKNLVEELTLFIQDTIE